MAKSKKHRFWITATLFALIISGVFFFPQTNTVRALFGNEHIAEVLFRFWNEILTKSPAGQYYQSLAWKHVDELNQILSGHREHRDKEFLQTIQMIIPGLEALVDGKGDTVQITEEQINSLKAELDWLSSRASPLLREDIEKEQQRFPLDNFIGMTMSEGLDYVNTNWQLDPSVELPATPVIPTPSALVCLTGPDPDCLEKPNLVPDSTGMWASYTYNNIYFEYPSIWQIQQQKNKDEFIFIPTSDSSEGVNLDFLLLQISSDRLIENWNQTITDPQLKTARETNGWMQLIYLNDFQGFAVLVDNAVLEVMLYNENDKIYIDLMAYIKHTRTAVRIDRPEDLEKVFPNLQHIIESIRISMPD